MDKLKTQSPTYCIMDNWEEMVPMKNVISCKVNIDTDH